MKFLGASIALLSVCIAICTAFPSRDGAKPPPPRDGAKQPPPRDGAKQPPPRGRAGQQPPPPPPPPPPSDGSAPPPPPINDTFQEDESGDESSSSPPPQNGSLPLPPPEKPSDGPFGGRPGERRGKELGGGHGKDRPFFKKDDKEKRKPRDVRDGRQHPTEDHTEGPHGKAPKEPRRKQPHDRKDEGPGSDKRPKPKP